MKKVSVMTVTPIRMVTMSSPTVTTVDSPPQIKTASRISNFSVASLLADTRRRSKSPPLSPVTRITFSSNINNNNNESPKNLSTSQQIHHGSCSPHSQHNNDSSSSLKNDGSEDRLRLDRRSHTPHSSIASDEYDDSLHEDDDDEDVDIEEMNGENSTNPADKSSANMLPSSALAGGHVPIRPTPFSALAAAAAAWGSAGQIPGWPNRQMQPFGPPGLFSAQGFPGQMNGGELCSSNRLVLRANEESAVARTVN